MKKPKLNADWHKEHRMPLHPTLEQRIEWHLQHQQHCACRPIPEKLLEEIKKRKKR